MKNSALLGLSLLTVLTACNGKDDKKTNNSIAATCRAPIAEAVTKGNCRIRLLSPASCAAIDISGGKSANFSWTTDGTDCHAPYTAYLAGHPVTRNADRTLNNVNPIQLDGSEGEVSDQGGVVPADARHFEGLTSDDGTYEWTIAGGEGDQPASLVIRVKR